MAARPRLCALARRLGVMDAYVSADGRTVTTSDATREALVAAMGFEATSEEAAGAALARLGPTPSPGPAPPPCPGVRERLGRARGFGIWANLYTLRSDADSGFGDLGDLRSLVERAAASGAAFVGLNPLHALANRAGDECPYAPVSRLFRNPLYLRIDDVPGFAALSAGPGRQEAARARRDALRRAPRLETRALEEALFAALRPLHAALRRGVGDPSSWSGYERYRAERGEELLAFATFQALADHFEPETGARDWRRWPDGYREPNGPAVRRFREASEEAVDFHAWLQFEVDRQLESAAGHADRLGMEIGLYADLALGSGPGGFDTWAYRPLFASGASVGAPPDAFSPAGQDWGFPPLDPHALRRDGFVFWRRILEANLHGAGALRIDHALGLRRLFWIPDGASPEEGAYVRQPEADLLGVLGEVSGQRGALVIGEDLGTVPEGFSKAIQAAGMLSSRVLLFERDADGFRPSSAWPEACLATANTHDLPPFAAWLEGEDLALRRAAGHIPDDATRDRLLRERETDRADLGRRLLAEGCLAEAAAHRPDPEAWIVAVTRFLCRTPSALVGLSLDDLAGEVEPINLPGVAAERHRSWVRRMRRNLDEIFGSDRAREILGAVPAARRSLR